jgi:cation transport regulator ChaB
MSGETHGILLNHILSLMIKRIIVPGDFHGRVKAVKEMLQDDVTGLVDSLTDFAVETAAVDYNIETNNDELTSALKKWLEQINRDFRGKIPSGIKPLAEEYFKERWKYSSFPVLKISGWEVDPKSKLLLPSKMFFLDGGSIYAKDKNPDDQGLSIEQYDYYLGKNLETKNKLDSNIIFTRQNGRWHDKYPVPFLIKRGIYRNWRIIEAIKSNEMDILDQVIPYMLLIKKGTERLAIDKGINYDDKKLKQVIEQLEELIQKAKSSHIDLEKSLGTPVRASQFDEEIKHLIPDLSAIFNPDLFVFAEKNILAGLGFIDVVDASTSTRRESILNPKPFIQEVYSGVDAFKQLLKEVLFLIIEKNQDHPKYMNADFEITSSPIRGFMTDKFKERIRQLYDRGRISSKTAVELIGELDFEVEVKRREKETRDGIEHTMYPPVVENREGTGEDILSSSEGDHEIPDDKAGIQARNFDKASLDQEPEIIASPFQSVKDLPQSVRDNLPTLRQRRKWLRIFNSAFNFYLTKFNDEKKAESRAFATAWAKVDKPDSKPDQEKPRKKEAELDTAGIEREVLEEEIAEKKNQLLDHLLEKSRE